MFWYFIGALIIAFLTASHWCVYRLGVRTGENRLSKFTRALNAGNIWPTGMGKEAWLP